MCYYRAPAASTQTNDAQWGGRHRSLSGAASCAKGGGRERAEFPFFSRRFFVFEQLAPLLESACLNQEKE